jgi:YegS/Rv2252/BmrU family lipid kinase
MRAAIIINPRSGLKKTHTTAGGTRLERAKRWVESAGVRADIHETTRSGHAGELAAKAVAAGVDRIVAWGGDGTVNEVAGALFGTVAALGIVPGGSGDGLARSLGLPRDPEQAMRIALTGKTKAIDVGWLAGRHFLNIAGAGFDAEVARRFSTRLTRGTRGYLAESLSLVWSYACSTYRIKLTASSHEFAGPQFLVAFANGREYGSGLVIAPDADPSDGWLDMVLVTGGGPVRQLWRSRRLAFRRMSPAEGVWRDRVKGASIEGERLSCHVDGEPFEAHGLVEVRLEPGALNVVCA